MGWFIVRLYDGASVISHLLRQRGFAEITRRTPTLAVALLRSALCGLACYGLQPAVLQLDRLGGHRLDSWFRAIHEQDFSLVGRMTERCWSWF